MSRPMRETDKYGNPLDEPTKAEDIPVILQNVKKANPPPLTHTEKWPNFSFLFLGDCSHSLFVACIFYVNQCKCSGASILDIITLDLRMYGAKISESLNASVSHILVHDDCKSHQLSLEDGLNKKPVIVTPLWVEECIKRGGV